VCGDLPQKSTAWLSGFTENDTKSSAGAAISSKGHYSYSHSPSTELKLHCPESISKARPRNLCCRFSSAGQGQPMPFMIRPLHSQGELSGNNPSPRTRRNVRVKERGKGRTYVHMAPAHVHGFAFVVRSRCLENK
jgi:hypothetical protein